MTYATHQPLKNLRLCTSVRASKSEIYSVHLKKRYTHTMFNNTCNSKIIHFKLLEKLVWSVLRVQDVSGTKLLTFCMFIS